MKFMDTVGSSIFTKGKGSTQSVAQAVWPMFNSAMPDTAMMSPSWAESCSTRLRPSNWYSLVMRAFWRVSSAPPQMVTVCPTWMEPRSTRPMPMRPT